MPNRARKNLLSLIFLVFLLQACVATQSFPTVARGGDTITLAVGSPDGMTKTNTSAQFVSDIDGSMVALPVRSIFRLRPDQTSRLALFNPAIDSQDYSSGHPQWISIIVIDLPAGLTVGSGVININSTADYGRFLTGINEMPVAIDIIAGSGTRSEFTYDNGYGGVSSGDLTALEPLEQAVFKIKNTSIVNVSSTSIAAAEIKVTVPLGSISDEFVRVVAGDFYTKNSQDQLQMSWRRSGDDFTVNFISPTASMQPRQLRFSVVIRGDVSFSTTPAPVVSSVQLYDGNGNLISLVNNAPDVDVFTIGVE